MKKYNEHTDQEAARKLGKYAWLSFCGEDTEATMRRADERFKTLAYIIAAATLLLLVLGYCTSGSGKTPAERLIRNEYGGDARDISVNVSASYGDVTLEKELELRVNSRALTEEEAQLLLDSCEEYIRTEVIVTDHVSSDLSLPERSPDGLVEISWHSGDPSRLGDDGTVDLLEIPRLCAVELRAEMRIEHFVRELSFVIEISEGDPRESMNRSLDLLAEELSSEDGGISMELPDERDGIDIQWSFPGKEVPWELLPLAAFVLLAVYFGRYDPEEKRMRKKASEFEREIPSMTLQLILLLNAGLVVSAAFDEIIDKNSGNGSPLYAALENVRDKAEGENLSFISELYVFANTTGCRDFIRLSSLILDHSNRGSELAGKLEKERAQLWSSRLSAAKARTKEAETKLCFPLMLLLCVLVVISAAPALMTM